MVPKELELVQGTLELVILKTLASAPPKHGFDILRFISDATDGGLLIEEGSLYPALHRMEKRGLIEAEWGLSENNRKAKYYRLTNAGRKRLVQQERHWERYVVAVANIMNAAGRA